MGDIFYAPYTLTFRDSAARAQRGEQRGALIRHQDGVADLFPLTAFGDPPLDRQLAALASGAPLALGRIALWFAGIDATARARGLSLFEGTVIPESHWLVPQLTAGARQAIRTELAEAERLGFTTFKCKIGANPVEEAKVLSVLATEFPCQIFRLDANGRFHFDMFVAFWDALPGSLRSRIEFVEDPMPSTDDTWAKLAEAHKVPIARDFEDGYGYRFRVIKPARESACDIVKDEAGRSVKFVVTTSLDHPIGQLQAAYVAAHFERSCAQPLLTCGLTSHLVYEANSFSEQLGLDGSRLVAPEGTGWGFDEELERLPWTTL